MPIYDVEIRVTRIYQVEGIRAKDEEAAIAKAFKKYEKDPDEYFDDAMDEAEADEVEKHLVQNGGKKDDRAIKKNYGTRPARPSANSRRGWP